MYEPSVPFPLNAANDYGFSLQWVKTEEKLRRSPNGAELLKKNNSGNDYKAPRAGEIFKNPGLAKTFRLLASDGKAGFYQGPVADAIIQVTSSLGGYLTHEDLLTHSSEATDPVPIRLNISNQGTEEINLWEHPPNGQGIVAQMALGIFQQLLGQGQIPNFSPEDHNSAR